MTIWSQPSDKYGQVLTYKCHHCAIKGFATPGWEGKEAKIIERKSPAPPEQDKREVAAWLWAQSLPLSGSLAEKYLISRHCYFPDATLRFLPGRSYHHSAMIGRFGSGDVTGVHVTSLTPDGRKAECERNKLMVGPSMGLPLIVVDRQSSILFVTEGIEDALSIASVTKAACYAAGAAIRIAPLIAAVRTNFRQVYLAVDDDDAGRKAFVAARAVAPVRPVRFPRGYDANKVLVDKGPSALRGLLVEAAR
jgi:hypothetical protein